jgi:hypothetical protein
MVQAPVIWTSFVQSSADVAAGDFLAESLCQAEYQQAASKEHQR